MMEVDMSIRKLMVSGLLAAFITSPFVVSTAFAADDHIYMAGLAYRTGPYAPNLSLIHISEPTRPERI